MAEIPIGGRLSQLRQVPEGPSLRAAPTGWRANISSGLRRLLSMGDVLNPDVVDFLSGIGPDVIPAVSTRVGFEDAKREYQAGRPISGTLDLLMAGAGAVPGVAAVAKPAAKAAKKSIRAYHGSPHLFDRFSMEKIGTGEGAQAYGHGLYFAEHPEVAASYKDMAEGMLLQNKPLDTVWVDEIRERWPDLYKGLNEDDAMVMDTLVGTMQGMETMSDLESAAKSVGGSANRLFRERVKPKLSQAPPGKMYEVDISADPEKFLDWDAPLSQQPKELQKIAREADLSGVPSRLRRKIEAWRGEYKPPSGAVVEEPTGSELHSALTDFGKDVFKNAELTKKLSEAGIPGIKYFDQLSRDVGKTGTRNYVVFDENLIKIVKQYGIPAAIAAGLLTQQNADQMSEQGLI